MTPVAHQLLIPGRGWIECEPHAAEAERQRGGRVRELVVQPEWQPIKTAPRDASDIIVLTPNRAGCRGCLIAHFAHGGGEDQPPFGPPWFLWTGYEFREMTPQPTHWMPLPPLPALTQETPR